MAEVRLANLTKHYGPVVAVDSLDVTIRDKEFFALLDRRAVENLPP